MRHLLFTASILGLLLMASCSKEDTTPSIDCGANGTAVDGICNCDPGYEGDNCETEARIKHVGSYQGDMIGCVPGLVIGFLPADIQQSLSEVELIVALSEDGPTILDITANSSVLNFVVKADVAEDTFVVEEFSENVSAGGFDVKVTGSGNGMFIDADNMEISLTVNYNATLINLDSDCTVTFSRI